MLVVEDEGLIAQDIAWVIEKEMQFTVVAIASTVEEALSVLANEKLDGAVLDVHLDGESTESVAAALLELNIPFFVLSGYCCTGTPAGAAQKSAYVTKTL